MKLLIKNPQLQNVGVRIINGPDILFDNLGPDGAVVEGNKETSICLAPTAVALPEPTGFRSQCFELNDNGRYAVEINGVVQPYAFTPTDLMDCFNGQHESLVRFLECNEPKPEISCDGAVPVFEAKTSFETNVIEVSVDDGPRVDIFSAEGIYVSFMPGNPGADIRFNLDGSDPKRVRVRASRDIGLYVNPLTGFDQINTNKAYTLYDRNGAVIDPFDPNNQDHSGTEFDDTTSTDDFAVFFAQAEFCLALEPEESFDISCEGATTEAYIAFNGWDSVEYDVEINGVTARVVVTTPSNIVSAYLESVPDANLEGLYVSGGSSSTHTLYNTNETTDYRIRIMPISSANLTEEELIAKFNGNVWEDPPQNPTFGYDTTTGEITFCLAHVVGDGMVDAEASGLQVLWTKTLTAGDEYGLTYSLDDGATQEQVTWTVPYGEMYLSHAYYNLFKQIPLVKSEDTPAGTQYAFTVELSPHSLAFDLNGNSRVYPDSTPVKVTVYPKPHATNAAYDKSLYDDYPDATIGTFISGGLLTS